MNFKKYLKNLSYKLYLSKLPKKRMGVGCLIFDSREKVLILKPTYKDCWLLPGGVIETSESPRQACIRELKEETGIDCRPTNLLCVDYVVDRLSALESIQFIFLVGTIGHDISITIPKQEISTYKFLELKQAIPMLGVNSQRRLQSCLPYLQKSQRTVYLENGMPV